MAADENIPLEIELDPPSPLPEPIIAFEGIEPISQTSLPEVVWRSIKRTINSFGFFREYPNIPTHNPDNALSLLNMVDDSPPINEMELTGDGLSADVSTHCRRELIHAVWANLLDDDFLYANCEHGNIILCPDGTSRRFYQRVFTYSADYPEK